MTSAELPEPPEGFFRYPAGNVIALMTDGDAVSAAIDDLTSAGFAREAIYVLVGPTGAESLDVAGRHHGLRGRIYRVVERVGDEREELLRAVNHLEAGGFALRVPVTEDDKALAARIVKEHGAVHAAYLGKATYEPLGP